MTDPNDTVYSSRIWTLPDSRSVLAHDVDLQHSKIQRSEQIATGPIGLRALLKYHSWKLAAHNLVPEVFFAFCNTPGAEVCLTICIPSTEGHDCKTIHREMPLLEFYWGFLGRLGRHYVASQPTGTSEQDDRFLRFGLWECNKSIYAYQVRMNHPAIASGRDTFRISPAGLVYAALVWWDIKRVFVAVEAGGVSLTIKAYVDHVAHYKMLWSGYRGLLSMLNSSVCLERCVTMMPNLFEQRPDVTHAQRTRNGFKNWPRVNWLKEGF